MNFWNFCVFYMHTHDSDVQKLWTCGKFFVARAYSFWSYLNVFFFLMGDGYLFCVIMLRESLSIDFFRNVSLKDSKINDSIVTSNTSLTLKRFTYDQILKLSNIFAVFWSNLPNNSFNFPLWFQIFTNEFQFIRFNDMSFFSNVSTFHVMFERGVRIPAATALNRKNR